MVTSSIAYRKSLHTAPHTITTATSPSRGGACYVERGERWAAYTFFLEEVVPTERYTRGHL